MARTCAFLFFEVGFCYMQKLFTLTFCIAVLFLGYQIFFSSAVSPLSSDEKESTQEVSEVFTDLIILKNLIENGKNSGTGNRSFQDGLYTHTIRATLVDPPDEFLYRAWLKKAPEKDADQEQIITTGILKKNMESGVFELHYEEERDLSSFQDIFVTLQPQKEEKFLSDKIVLQGKF